MIEADATLLQSPAQIEAPPSRWAFWRHATFWRLLRPKLQVIDRGGKKLSTNQIKPFLNFALVFELRGVTNTRSRAIPERLGFREEGVLRAAERIGTRVIDHAVYVMTARDWKRAEYRKRLRS